MSISSEQELCEQSWCYIKSKMQRTSTNDQALTEIGDDLDGPGKETDFIG